MVIKYAIRDKLIYKVELIQEKQSFTFLRFHGKAVCVGETLLTLTLKKKHVITFLKNRLGK